MNININCNGYKFICLVDGKTKKRKMTLIHRLVAFLFVSGITNGKNIVDHIDENKLNNYYKNLEWVTPRENTTLSLGKPVVQIDPTSGKIIKRYRSIKSALQHLNKSLKSTNITMCCKGITKSAYGYKWKMWKNNI